MSDSEAPAPVVEKPVENAEREGALIFPYIEKLRELFPIEFIKEFTRITPKGLFVEQSKLQLVVDSYQAWAIKTFDNPSFKNTGKIRKKLFGEHEPPLQYLVEGKLSLAGYLIPCPIQAPQNLKLPFFLGSLSDTRSTLHPKDPIFAELSFVEPVQTPTGLEFKCKLKDALLQFTLVQLKEFVQIALNSPRTAREFPKLTSTLAESLRAFITLLEKSRAQRKEQVLLVPEQYRDLNRYTFRSVGGWVFVFDKQNKLRNIYELRAKNLYLFIRREFSALRNSGQKKIGIFELFGDRDHFLGAFNLTGRRVARLHPRSFQLFIESLQDSPEKRDRFTVNFTIRQAFEKFSTLFQTSQSIDGRLITSFIDPARARSQRFQVNGPWIFALGKDGTIEQCIAKHLGIRKSGPSKDRSRPPRTNSSRVRK